MANPYESKMKMTEHSAPSWSARILKLSVPAWWIGTALIAGSWVKIVSPTVGWIGFCIAGVASLASYSRPSFAGRKSEDYVILNSRMLSTKNETYHDVMNRFLSGAMMMHDGVAFAFRPNNVIACGVVAQSPDINETEAYEEALHAESVFETLKRSSTEFASGVGGHTFRISIMSGVGAGAFELFCIVDGQMESVG